MIIGPPIETLIHITQLVLSLYRLADDIRDELCLMPKIKIPHSHFGFKTGSYTVDTCFDLESLWDIYFSNEVNRAVDAYASLIEYQLSAQQDIVEAYLRLDQAFGKRITVEDT